MPKSRKSVFVSCVLGAYLLAILFTFMRVYVYHAYPIYYSGDEMPNIREQLRTLTYWPRL